MPDAIRPLIAGNWKMNGLKASSAEFEAMLAGAARVAAKADLLVCPPATLMAVLCRKGARLKGALRSVRRIATPRPRAPIPAIFQPKCWRMPAPAPSLSATPNGAPIMARAMRWFGKRPKRPGAPG